MGRKALIGLALTLLIGSAPSGAQSPDWMFGPFEKPAPVNPTIAPSSASTFMWPMTDSIVRWEALATFNPRAAVNAGTPYAL